MQVEDELLDRCKSGDKRAQQALFKACFPFLMKCCRLYSRDEQEAMAYLNAGFFKILKGLKGRKSDIPFAVWARRVLVNCIIDHYRKHRKYREQIQSVEDLTELHFTYQDFDSNLADLVFETGDLLAMIRDLTEMTSRVFLLYAVEEFNYREIALKMKISESTVRWHVSKARSELIKMMEIQTSKKKVTDAAI